MPHSQNAPSFPIADLVAQLDPEMQRALLEAASSPAGAALVHRLGEHFGLAPALLDMFDLWRGNTSESNDSITIDQEKDDSRDEQLDELLHINDTLAAALGACAMCWGDDEQCDECEGEGGPGSTLPDPELFHALVSPALLRVKAHRARRRPRLAPSPSFTANSRG